MPAKSNPADAERLLFDPSTIGARDVLLVGRYHYRSAHPPLSAHAHEGVIELCFLERGRQVYSFAAGAVHCLRGGEVLVTQPGEVHGTGNLPEFPGRLYWLQLAMPAAGGSFLGLGVSETAAFCAALRTLPRQFRGSPELRDDFEAMLAAASTTPALRAVVFRTRVLSLLLRCIETAASQGGQSSLPHPIARALDGLTARAMNRIKVAEMAQIGHLSESYFKALFREAMGVPPAEFLRVLRLEHAQLRLRTTRDAITDIALDTGFSSSQHFAAAFRQHFGCTPRAFRRKSSEPIRETKPKSGAGVGFHPTASAK